MRQVLSDFREAQRDIELTQCAIILGASIPSEHLSMMFDGSVVYPKLSENPPKVSRKERRALERIAAKRAKRGVK